MAVSCLLSKDKASLEALMRSRISLERCVADSTMLNSAVNLPAGGIANRSEVTFDGQPMQRREDLNLRPPAPKAGQKLPSNSRKLLKTQARLVEQPLKNAPAIGTPNGTPTTL